MYNTCVFVGLAIYGYSDHVTGEFTFQKLLQKMYNTCVLANLAIYGYSDHKTDITIESAIKNCS
jgi:hypothetical protein